MAQQQPKRKRKIKQRDLQSDLSALLETREDINADWSYPEWTNAPSAGFCDALEVFIFRFITIVPVIITFCLFAFLGTFYVYCFLYPCLIEDFGSTLGLPEYWSSASEREQDKYWAEVLLIVFIFCTVNLFAALLLTIFTNPGNIPVDHEWDMPDEQFLPVMRTSYGESDSDISSITIKTQQNFDNQEIIEDTLDPREPTHFDYRYINCKAGPMYEGEYDRENYKLLKYKKLEKQPVQSQFEKKKYGGVRMCQRCLRTKPDRTHHCSQCGKCILKMDHHCPWVGNCIGFYNYKYFLNMLFYASVTTLIIVVTSYPVFIAVLAHEKVDNRIAYFVVTAWILALAFCVLITSFFIFHMWLLSNQYTTLEFCETRSKNNQFEKVSPYDRGCCLNFQAVCGRNILLWCFPCNRNLEGDGLRFEIRDELKKTETPEGEEDEVTPN